MPSLALQYVSGCFALLCFKFADNACSWLFSLWVAVVFFSVSNLLTTHILDSLGCEVASVSHYASHLLTTLFLVL